MLYFRSAYARHVAFGPILFDRVYTKYLYFNKIDAAMRLVDVTATTVLSVSSIPKDSRSTRGMTFIALLSHVALTMCLTLPIPRNVK